MAELRENSILFSLNGLFQRERERVTEEAERERLRVEAEQLERLERERRSFELQESERREREENARREAQRCREQEARLEALRRAEVLRACAEAEAKARIELDGQHREHELRLESIREQGGRRRAEQLAVGCAVVVVASWAAAAWLYFGQLSPERERRGENERLLQEERARSHELGRLVQVSDRRNADLATELKRTLGQRAPAPSDGPEKQESGAAPGTRPPAKGGVGAPRDGRERRGSSPPRARGPHCPDNRDPLDNCL